MPDKIDSAGRETVLVPAPRSNAGSAPPVTTRPVKERLRFGPGVPASTAPAAVAVVDASEPARRRQRAWVLSMAFTAAIVAFVVWFLWPSGPLHVKTVSVQAPAIVSCGRTADVVASVTTNGNPGTLLYRWDRGDGQRSGLLRQSLSRGQRKVDLHLSWKFTGPGTYPARATVDLLEPAAKSATVRFTYRCTG